MRPFIPMIPDSQTVFLGNGLELVDTVILRQRVKDSDCPAILKIEVVPYALASCALNRSRQLSAGKTGRFHRENLYPYPQNEWKTGSLQFERQSAENQAQKYVQG